MRPIKFNAKIVKRKQLMRGVTYIQYLIFIPKEFHSNINKGQIAEVTLNIRSKPPSKK